MSKRAVLAVLLSGVLMCSGCAATDSMIDMAYAIDNVTGMYGMTPEQMKLYLSDEAYRIATASEDSLVLFEDMSEDVMSSAYELVKVFEDDAYKALDISSDVTKKVFKLTDLILASNVIDLEQVIGASDLETIAKRGEIGASASFLKFLATLSPETIQNVVKIENLKPFYYDVQRYTREEFGDMFAKAENITLGDLERELNKWSAKATPIMDNLLDSVDINQIVSTIQTTQSKVQDAMTLDDILENM